MKNNLKLLVITTILLLPNLTFAQHEVGNGGDPDCSQFYSYASKIALLLKDLGQEKVDRVNPKIDVAKIWEIKSKIKCIPVQNLDRGARNKDGVVSLDTDKWKKADSDEHTRLTSHEMCSIAGLEGEGEYYASEDLFQLISTSPQFEILRSIGRIRENDELRFDEADGDRFSVTAEDNLFAVTQILQRMRELAIEAVKPQISSEDRKYLNEDFQNLKYQIERISEFSTFTDSFNEIYHYIENGINFKTIRSIEKSKMTWVKKMKVDALPFAELGTLALGNLDPKLPDGKESRSGYLVINYVPIASPKEESSLAIAEMINAKSNETGVRADAFNIWELKNLQFGKGKKYSFSKDDFKLNGISVESFSISNLGDFIDLLNTVTALTGVKAQLRGENEDELQLYAGDGRNIVVELNSADALQLIPEFEERPKNVQMGHIRLLSAEPFVVLSKNSPFFDFQGPIKSDCNFEIGLASRAAEVESREAAKISLVMLDKALNEVNIRRSQAGGN